MRNHKGFTLVCVVGGIILAIGSLFWVGVPPWIEKPNSTGQATIATATATFIVGWFAITAAWYAKRDADIGRDAVNTAINAERNAAIPFIKLEFASQERSGTAATGLVNYSNVGRGIALNLYRQLMGVDSDPTNEGTALGLGEKGAFRQSFPRGDSHIKMLYSDVYGRRFESELTITVNQDRESIADFQHRQVTQA